MQNIEINIHGFRFIEIETGYVAKPNRTAINRVPLSALIEDNKEQHAITWLCGQTSTWFF